MYYTVVLLASKPHWKSRPQRKRHRSGNDDDDDDIENDTPVQVKKDSNLGFVSAKDQYVSALYNFYVVKL